MRVRFKGEGDGRPCEVFGQVFPVGEWVAFDHPKLAGNPMFEVEGAPETPEASLEELRAELDGLGVSYSPRAGVANLAAKLAEAKAQPEPDPDAEPEA